MFKLNLNYEQARDFIVTYVDTPIRSRKLNICIVSQTFKTSVKLVEDLQKIFKTNMKKDTDIVSIYYDGVTIEALPLKEVAICEAGPNLLIVLNAQYLNQNDIYTLKQL